MDYCDICFDPPRPIACAAAGTVRLDAKDGDRRLLGEISFREPVRLHFIEVGATRRIWNSEGWALCAVTVYNRSSLPLGRVSVAPGASAFSDGIIRVNGVAAGADGAVLQGLGPGCAGVITWEIEGTQPEEHMDAAQIDYAYRFGGEVMTGVAYSE